MRYIFEPEKLHQIAAGAVGMNKDEVVAYLERELAKAYPGHIHPHQDWVFSLFCSCTGMLKILHASLTEYVILFGTPLGTKGFSGRYKIEIWDAMISGEMWTAMIDRPFHKEIYRPGDLAYLPKGKVKAWGVSEDGWMLEYGRGLIPTALPVGVGDSVFSAMDPVTLLKTLWIYGKVTVKEMLKGKL